MSLELIIVSSRGQELSNFPHFHLTVLPSSDDELSATRYVDVIDGQLVRVRYLYDERACAFLVYHEATLLVAVNENVGC